MKLKTAKINKPSVLSQAILEAMGLEIRPHLLTLITSKGKAYRVFKYPKYTQK
jgi:hypothetical protein